MWDFETPLPFIAYRRAPRSGGKHGTDRSNNGPEFGARPKKVTPSVRRQTECQKMSSVR
jgi:hypothetical protein